MVSQTLDQRITTQPGVLGGKPCLAGRRIAVAHIVHWHEREGQRAEEIASAYDLDLADVYAALAYYFANREAMDEDSREGEAFVQEMQQQHSSLLAEKLGDKARLP